MSNNLKPPQTHSSDSLSEHHHNTPLNLQIDSMDPFGKLSQIYIQSPSFNKRWILFLLHRLSMRSNWGQWKATSALIQKKKTGMDWDHSSWEFEYCRLGHNSKWMTPKCWDWFFFLFLFFFFFFTEFQLYFNCAVIIPQFVHVYCVLHILLSKALYNLNIEIINGNSHNIPKIFV